MKFNNRIKKVISFLEKKLETIVDKYNVKTFIFNENVYESTNASDIKVEPKGTRIDYVIDKLISKIANRTAVILITDGINLSHNLPKLKNENVSVIPITFNEQNFKDVSLSDVRYSNTGFKDIEHKFNIEVLNYGYDNKSISIKLIDIEKQQTLARQEVVLRKEIVKVELSFIPTQVGKYRFRVELEKLPEEISYENNFREIEINVRKNKIRILYICGQPSPEYFQLRNLMKNDPLVDLVSFVILRNPESIVIVPDEDLALIPFPVNEIFLKELFNYDLIIFENFSYRGFWVIREHLENVKKFVISGGGFIMIGGKNSFFSGGYKFTPIEEILPVVIDEKEQLVYTEYKPEVVDYNNPLINVYDDDSTNKLVWKNIPNLGNYQKVAGLKPTGKVLLQYGNIPIMCYWTAGKGRVFVSMTNTTWRWVLGNLLSEKYDYKYLHNKFWKNIIYYTAGVEDIKLINLLCDDIYNPNEHIDIQLISNVKLKQSPQVFITYPDKNKKTLYVSKVSDSLYATEFIPELEGKYIITATANYNNEVIKEQKEIKVGLQSYDEIERLKVDLQYLNSLANEYKTKVYFIDQVDLRKIIDEIGHKSSTDSIMIFDVSKSPLIGFLFIVLFLLEIYLAKVK
ncbi:MAG: glutamine amidotransferase [Endomicrobia bacterium]|nr:glutamine amidotransferase [Endomicrobiia bacterium]